MGTKATTKEQNHQNENARDGDYKYTTLETTGDDYKYEVEHEVINIDNIQFKTSNFQKQRRLILKKRELRLLRRELTILHRDSIIIVHGYSRDLLKDKYDHIPLDILNLLVDFVGDHFANAKMEESAQEIIKLVGNNTNHDHDPMVSDENPYKPQYDHHRCYLGEWILLFLCCCCPFIVVALILYAIAYILTFGFCCNGKGIKWIKMNICCC